MPDKSVSVIIPTYNRAHFIQEAIDSVLRQDIKDCDIEIIVIDDGSMDNTGEIVSGYKDRVRYIRLANGGAGRARNKGMEAAQGDWISFLDSDDRWLPDKLSLQFKVLERFPEIKVIHSNFYTFEGDRITIKKGLEFWVESLLGTRDTDWSNIYSHKYSSSELGIHHRVPFHIYSGNIFAAMLYAPYGACWTMLIRRGILCPGIRFAEDFPTWEDYWFLCRLAEYNEILFMDVPTAENRGHQGPRLTSRPDFIDPLRCHLRICKDIFFNSESSFRPDMTSLNNKYRELHYALMREYLKTSQLDKAKSVRKRLQEIGGVERSLVRNLYFLSSFLPFNAVGMLKNTKNKLEKMIR